MYDRIYIHPVRRMRSETIKEKNSYFLCPNDTVLTGRCHSGDENGKTWYEYSALAAFDENGNSVQGDIKIEDSQWSSWIKESSGNGFDADNNRIIVGREHKGDENGNTRYAIGKVTFNGRETLISSQISSSKIKESKGIWVVSDSKRVMTGRHHSGDENGNTYYNFSEVTYIFQTHDRAPEGTLIIPKTRHTSVELKESSSSFLCPPNTVMTGRLHVGDENGTTYYEYAELMAIKTNGEEVAGVVAIRNIQWIDNIKESYGLGYDAPYGKVIVGRRHTGDENGETSYAIGDVFFNGFPTIIKHYKISAPLHESSGKWFKCDENFVITGRHHYGDENGTTYYGMGIISCDEYQSSSEKVIIHVKHSSDEKYLPMNPEDYIRLCRVRRHNAGASDDGYNKNTASFVNGNSKADEYYDIPVSTLSTFHLVDKYELLNIRPKDDNSIGKGELFLQPDDHLHGDALPNKRVASIKYEEENGKRISYWLFWGYDFAEPEIKGVPFRLQGNHEGDWECITILLNNNNRIQNVILSQHTESKIYEVSDLDIKHDMNKDELTVYCASGSHALYNKPGKYTENVKLGYDVTDGAGCDWIITDKVESLNDESTLWKHYSGGWGEVGEFAFTTGPLGPWQKCGGLILEVQKHNNPPLHTILKDGQLLLVYDHASSLHPITIKESVGDEVCAPANCILYSRVHAGDENGNTYYEFCSLKAVDAMGENHDGEITVEDLKWSEWHKQSSSSDFFISTYASEANRASRVITGRQHTGDENGMTRYQTGVVKYNGKEATIVYYPQADLIIKENMGTKVLPKDNLVIIGIKHSGDENGYTTICQGYILIS